LYRSIQSPTAHRTVALRLAGEGSGQFLLCSACLERVVGILRRVFQVIFNPLNAELNPICHLLTLLGAHPIFHISRIRVNIIVKKVMSKKEIIQFTKEFPIPRDRRAADFKDNKKDKIWDGIDLTNPFSSPFHPEKKKCLHQDSVAQS